MAKKKMTHQPTHENPTLERQGNDQEQSFTQAKPLERQASMEDPAEKLQNLKSLNSLLLKETFERRQQVESLIQAKKALESESARFSDERKGLEAELSEGSEKNLGLELEKCLLWVYVETQMWEMGVSVDSLVKEKTERENEVVFLKGEVKGLIKSFEKERVRLNQVCQERDLAKSDLDIQIKEAKRLKERIVEMEKKEREVGEEMMKLKGEYEKLVKEKEGQEKRIKEVAKERDLVGENLKYAVNEVEGLKRKIEEIVEVKKEIENEKTMQRVKIDELEKEVEKQQGIVMSLRKEEDMLRTKVLEWENSYAEAMQREAERATEIGTLLQEKGEMEKTIEKLMDEKDSASRTSEMLMVESADKQRKVERLMEENDESRKVLEKNEKQIKEGELKIMQLLREKNEVERVKVSFESENVDLKKELSQLKDVVSKLEESCRDAKEKNIVLSSEVHHHRDAFELLTVKKDDALKRLAEEKENGVKLRSEISGMERKIEEIAGEFAQIVSEKEKLIKETNEMESQLKLLSTEKDGFQKDLLEAKKRIDDLKVKMDSTRINYERSLTVLKNTTSLVCQSPKYNNRDVKQEAAATEQKLEEEIEPYSAELEAIKKAFRDKETMVEDLEREVEFMKNSMAKAEKKKSFWTVVSSAITIFAAASVAYAVRLH